MLVTIYRNQKTTREVRRRVPIAPNTIGAYGTGTEPDGKEEIAYNVELDFDTVRNMARKAAASKGKKSTDGPLTVRVVKQTKL